MVIRCESRGSIVPGPAHLADDHIEVACVVLRAGRVDQLTEPAHVEARAAKVLRGWAADASHEGGVRGHWSIVRCEALTSTALAVLRESTQKAADLTTDDVQGYKVSVNFVYPLLVIAEQPDVFDRNVMEKGEHV
jgi:hypothetical protein